MFKFELQGKESQDIFIEVGRISMVQGIGAEAGVHANGVSVFRNDPLELLLIRACTRVCWVNSEVFGYRDIEPVGRKRNIAEDQAAQFVQSSRSLAA